MRARLSHFWSGMDVVAPDFGPHDGRGPVHAGRASHSAHRMRRSSSPTLIKTKAASSLPVFDPANMAGTPYAFLTVALLAMATFQKWRLSKKRLRSAAPEAPGTQGTRIWRDLATDRLFGGGGSATLSVTDNCLGARDDASYIATSGRIASYQPGYLAVTISAARDPSACTGCRILRESPNLRCRKFPGTHWRRDGRRRLVHPKIAISGLIDVGADRHFDRGMAW